MSIKVTIGESKTQEGKSFPKLMKLKSNESIVFFIRYGVGVPILDSGKSKWDLEALIADKWDMRYFEDFNEPITLQNN